MLEDYIKEQPIVTKLLINSFNNNKIVQAYLFCGNDESFLLDYALSFSKKLITSNYDNSICNMIDKNEYPELKIINPVNNIIKKEQVIELQQSFLVKPTIGEKMVYIINGADKLHISSSNTILKFLEEPSDSIVAILLTSNINKVLPTIKSRCQCIYFYNKEDNTGLSLLYSFYKTKIHKIEDNIEEDFKIICDSSINFIKQLETIGIKEFIHYKESIFEIYKTKEELYFLFDFMIYFYYDILNVFISRDIRYMDSNKDLIYFIKEKNSEEKILKKLQLVENTKLKLDINMNLKLIMDRFLIMFCEV